jgi:hypothetical protein
MVNRVWKHHFGRGIVVSLSNFGKTGSRPTHPELLDWLAQEFVRQGWRLKPIHRLLMTSEAYRQTSAISDESDRLDPEGALYSRMPMVRLDAEQLYDTMLSVSGKLDKTPFGPGDAVQSREDGLVTPVGTERGWRRLLFVEQRRKRLATHLESFDFPQMNPNCVSRGESTVATQALYLMNNAMVEQLSRSFAERVFVEAGSDPGKQVERVYWIAFSRPPREEERRIGMDTLEAMKSEWAKERDQREEEDFDPGTRALSSYCHAILNSAAFLYVD